MQVLLECIFKKAYDIKLKCGGELAQMVECLLSMQEVLELISRFSNVFLLVISYFLFSCRYFFFSILLYSILALQCNCTKGLYSFFFAYLCVLALMSHTMSVQSVRTMGLVSGIDCKTVGYCISRTAGVFMANLDMYESLTSCHM